MKYLKKFESYVNPSFYSVGSDEKEFLSYCKGIADEVLIDELSSFQRVKSDKSFEWILDNMTNDAYVGLKFEHTPIGQTKNEKGEWVSISPFLEAFMRDSNSIGKDYFISMKIDVKYLDELIDKFDLKRY